MHRKISWVKEAFSRDLSITQEGQPIGGMHRNGLSNDVEAYLNKTHVYFDVTGFLLHSVTIHDRNADNQVIGHIEFRFGKRAELKLNTGDCYLWKRHNVLMREWDMILESTDGLPDKETVRYDLTRKFFEESGDIAVDELGMTTQS